MPPVVRNKALAAGAVGWLDELPGLIAGLERDWGITVGPPYPDATEAFGDGCVRLLRADEERGALLLERLGRPLHQLGLPLARRHEILCATAERVWRPAPGSGLPTGADKGRWLIGYIETTWAELDRPCSERAVEHALAARCSPPRTFWPA